MTTRLPDDAALDRVYVDLVRPLLFEDLSASAAPELIMVGGQPGAGKTAATVQAVRDLMRHGGGVAYINGDELRPFHPQYAALVAADRSTAADKTGADVGLWVERAIREAAAGRFHAVIETTMRQPEVVRRTAEQFTAQGFGFEMRVVVVDPEASQLGIYERFATDLASPSALPRFTLPSYHADALAQMPKTLVAVVKLAKVVRFVDRQGGGFTRRGPRRCRRSSRLKTFGGSRCRRASASASHSNGPSWFSGWTAMACQPWFARA